MNYPRDLYDGRSPEELPAYVIPRAAAIVRLSPSTLRLWACGDGAHEALFKPVDPRRGFGQPVIAGTGLGPKIVAER